MDILSGPGTKVVFENPQNGHPEDKELASKYLEVDGIYTVEKIKAKSWHSEVFLEEVQGIAFNTVLFENKQEQYH